MDPVFNAFKVEDKTMSLGKLFQYLTTPLVNKQNKQNHQNPHPFNI